MSTVNTVITFEQLVQDFDRLFTRRVFRVETLDYYDAPNEHEPYARFLAGKPDDQAWREPWKEIVREHRSAGRTMQRVHVVTEPVSDYVRFELLRGYPASVEAGEDIRILGRQAAIRAGLSSTDFWLFDDHLAARLAYDRDGKVANVFMERDPAFVSWYRAFRDTALQISIQLADYVTEHNITEGKHAA